MAENAVVFPVCGDRDLEAELQRAMDCVMNRSGESLISDPAQAYTVHVAYDRIRDALMEKQEVWEQWKGIYWQKKYRSCLAVSGQLEESLKEQYMDRMQRELRRAMQTGQLDSTVFEAGEWKEITAMIRRCEGASGAVRSIPGARALARYIPKPVRRVLLNAVKRIVKAK